MATLARCRPKVRLSYLLFLGILFAKDLKYSTAGGTERCNCMISGDPHYTTLDGQTIHFQGPCTYIVAQSIKEDDPCEFKVSIQNEYRNDKYDVTYARNVYIEQFGFTIFLLKGAVEKPVFVDNVQVGLSFENEYFRLLDTDKGMGRYEDKRCGALTVTYDFKGKAKVEISGEYRGLTNGLCGVCDGNAVNDYNLLNGTNFGTGSQYYNVIGESYITEPFLDDVEYELFMPSLPNPDTLTHFGSTTYMNCAVQTKSLCTEEQRANILKNQRLCYYLNVNNADSPFNECLSQLGEKANGRLESCVMDVCEFYGDTEKMEAAACSAMSSLVDSECNPRNLVVNFRSEENNFCPMSCGDNEEYSAGLAQCSPTCSNEAPANCREYVQEGCYCQAGYVRSNNLCVPQGDCGCVYANSRGDKMYLELDETRELDDCMTELVCKKSSEGPTVEYRMLNTISCHQDAVCGAADGTFQCVCKPGFIGDGRQNCAKIPCLETQRKECQGKKCQFPYPIVDNGAQYVSGSGCFRNGKPQYRIKGKKLILKGKCSGTFEVTMRTCDSCGENERFRNNRCMCKRNFYRKNGECVRDVCTYTEVVTCEQGSKCRVNLKRRGGEALVKKIAPTENNQNQACVFDSSYGIKRRGRQIYVKEDCFGEFKLKIKQRGGCREALERFTEDVEEPLVAGEAVDDNALANVDETLDDAYNVPMFGDLIAELLVPEPLQVVEDCSRETVLRCNKQRCRLPKNSVIISYETSCQDDGVRLAGRAGSPYLYIPRTCLGTEVKVVYKPSGGCSQQCGDNAYMDRHGLCVCIDNMFGDPYFACRHKCQCSVSGDPHYRTGDGARIDFMGNCTYLLAMSTKADDICAFQVNEENEYRDGRTDVSYVKRVFIYHLESEVEFHKTHTVVNGAVMSPYESIEFFSGDHGFTISPVGKDRRFESTCGLIVDFNNNNFATDVLTPQEYNGHLTGMCGNCDGDPRNDYSFRNGTLAPTERVYHAEIGNSYLEYNEYTDEDASCNIGAALECPEERASEIRTNNALCGYLNPIKASDSPFASCFLDHPEALEKLLEECVQDVCQLFDDEDSRDRTRCSSYTIAAKHCRDHGIIVDFRSATQCELVCGENMEYSVSINPCANSCFDNGDFDCSAPAGEGCQCVEGFLFSNGRCVKADQCGCTVILEDIERYMEVGERIVLSDCQNVMVCQPGGLIVTEPQEQGCSENQECVNDDQQYQCQCKDGYKPSLTEPGTCEELPASLMDAFELECLAQNRRGKTYCKLPRGKTIVKAEPLNVGDSCLQKRRPYGFSGRTLWVKPQCGGTYMISFRDEGTDSVICGENAVLRRNRCRCKKGYFGDPTQACRVDKCEITKEVSCDAKSWKTYCVRLSYNQKFVSVAPVANSDNNDCVYRETYDVNRRGFWVQDGCGGNFVVKYSQKGGCEEAEREQQIEPAMEVVETPEETQETNEELFQELLQNLFEGVIGVSSNDANEITESSVCEVENVITCKKSRCSGPRNHRIIRVEPVNPTDENRAACSQVAIVRGGRQFKAPRGCRGDFKVISSPIDGCPIQCGKNAYANPRVNRRNPSPCLCNQGFAGDPFVECKEVCTCVGSGDPHYITYNKNKIHFMGNCTYTLSRSTKPDDECAFHVYEQNENRDNRYDISYVKNVYVDHLTHRFSFLAGGTVLVDGERSAIGSTFETSKGTLSLVTNGKSGIRLISPCDLQVDFDFKGAVVTRMPAAYKGFANGLCGPCDGVSANDYKTKDGVYVGSSRENHDIIGNSYQTSNPDPLENAESCGAPSLSAECPIDMSNMLASDDSFCGFLNPANSQSPFYDCLQNMISASDELEGCVFDLCHFKADEQARLKARCAALTSTASVCAGQGFYVNFRTNSFCPMLCGLNEEYNHNIDFCEETCSDISADHCSGPLGEGCVCKDGFVRSGRGCVPDSDCGCTIDMDGTEKYMQLGEYYVTNDCKVRSTCTSGSVPVQDVLQGCHEFATCSLVDGVHKCLCNAGLKGDGVTSCSAPDLEISQFGELDQQLVNQEENIEQNQEAPAPNQPLEVDENCKVTSTIECKKRRCSISQRNHRILSVTPIDASNQACAEGIEFSGRRIVLPRGCRGSFSVVSFPIDSCPVQCGKKAHPNPKISRRNPSPCLCDVNHIGDPLVECKEVCTCLGSGDPHYITYNKNKIHFMGNCTYTLSRSTKPDDACAFHVYEQNENRDNRYDISYVKNVYIDHLGFEVSLFLGGRMMVNGIAASLGSSFGDGTAHISLVESGRSGVRVVSSCGLQVEFDFKGAVVTRMPAAYKGFANGLCGPCDGVSANDFRLKDGTLVDSDRSQHNLIGNSYKTPNPDPLENAKNCGVAAPAPECPVDMSNMISSEDRYCGLLSPSNTNSPFHECLSNLEQAVDEFEGCVFDVCRYIDNEPGSVLSRCNALSSTASVCAGQGYPVNFRNDTFCPMFCGANEEYHYDASGCEPTCSDLSQDHCSGPGAEACVCKDGYVRSGTQCVTEDNCGCNYDDKLGVEKYMALGESFVTNDCGTKISCKSTASGPIITEESLPGCHELASCSLVLGNHVCQCNVGLSGDGVFSCELMVEQPILLGFDVAPEDTVEEPVSLDIPVKEDCTVTSTLECQRRRCSLPFRNHRIVSVTPTTPNEACTDQIKFSGRRISLPRGCRGAFTVVSFPIDSCPVQCGKNAHPNPKISRRNPSPCLCDVNHIGDPLAECKEVCTCLGSGDPHYITYNKNKIHFMGNCTYTLSRSTKPDDACAFHVYEQNENRDNRYDISYVKNVYIDHLGFEVSLFLGGRMMVNGIAASLGSSFGDGTAHISLVESGRSGVRVVSSCGLQVEFDFKGAVVTRMPAAYKGFANGLCGPCDGVSANDFKLKDGTLVDSDRSQHNLIGNSYKTPNPDPLENAKNCGVAAPAPECPVDMSNMISSEDRYCGLLSSSNTNSPFHECLSNLEQAVDEFEGCVFDVCRYINNEPGSVLSRCNTLSSTASVCAGQGYPVNFRNDTFCPMFCGANEEYHYDASGCEPTCSDLSQDHCSGPGAEACVCKDGYVRSGTQCVTEDNCGCNYLDVSGADRYLQLGETIISSDCKEKVVCEKTESGGPDVSIEVLQGCHEFASCALQDGKHECQCNEGYEGDGINACDEPGSVVEGDIDLLPIGFEPIIEPNEPAPKEPCSTEMVVSCSKRRCRSPQNGYLIRSVELVSTAPENKAACDSGAMEPVRGGKSFRVPRGCKGEFRLTLYPSDNSLCPVQCGLNAHPNPKITRRNPSPCLCNVNHAGNPLVECKEVCTCLGSGDPHYITYNKNKIHFMGNCTYTLSRSTKPDDACAFHVYEQNENRDNRYDISYVKNVYIDHLGLNIALLLGGTVLVNDETQYLGSTFSTSRGTLSISPLGKSGVRVASSCGLEVDFDFKGAVVTRVPAAYKGFANGLCGPCDGVSANDFRLKDGTLVDSDRSQHNLIGNSYLVANPDPDENLKNCGAPPASPECPVDMANTIQSQDNYCGYLSPENSDSPFYECLANVPLAAQELENCVFDVCRYDDDLDRQLSRCNALASTARLCGEQGYFVNFRSESFCPMVCPENEKYMWMVSDCEDTCTDSEVDECLGPSGEGCVCNEGYMRSAGACVPEEECGCSYVDGANDEKYLPLGASFVTSDCQKRVACEKTELGSEVTESNLDQCHSLATCSKVDNSYKCVCNPGTDGNGINCEEPQPLGFNPVEQPQEEVPQEVAPQEEVPQEVAPQEEVPQEVAPQEEVPQEVAPQEEVPQEVAPQEESPDNGCNKEEFSLFKGRKGTIRSTRGFRISSYKFLEDTECTADDVLIISRGNRDILRVKEGSTGKCRNAKVKMELSPIGGCPEACGTNAHRHRKGYCVCDKGFSGDPNDKCYQNNECTCLASGDPHYRTFDEIKLDFMGVCTYTLVESTGLPEDDPCYFHVMVQNEEREGKTGVSYTRNVYLDHMDELIELRNDGSMWVNKEKVTSYQFEKGGNTMSSLSLGGHIRIVSSCGLIVDFDMVSKALVSMDDVYKGKTSGLCGDCNGDASNDFRYANGTVVPLTTNRNVQTSIGDSYLVPNPNPDSDDDEEMCSGEVFTFASDLPVCDAQVDKRIREETEFCGFLNEDQDSPFEDCFGSSMRAMFENCVVDVCFVYEFEEERQKEVCKKMYEAASLCNQMGYVVDYRDVSQCEISCGENEHYVTDTSLPENCEQSCLDMRLGRPKSCGVISHGCVCQPGYYRSAPGKCVLPEDCGCLFEDKNAENTFEKYLQPYEEVSLNDCMNKKKCLPGGDTVTIKETDVTCHQDALCTLKDDGQKGCQCKPGYMGDGVTECKEIPKDCVLSATISCKKRRRQRSCRIPKKLRSTFGEIVEVIPENPECNPATYGIRNNGRSFFIKKKCQGKFTVKALRKECQRKMCGENAFFSIRRNKCLCKKGYAGEDPTVGCKKDVCVVTMRMDCQGRRNGKGKKQCKVQKNNKKEVIQLEDVSVSPSNQNQQCSKGITYGLVEPKKSKAGKNRAFKMYVQDDCDGEFIVTFTQENNCNERRKDPSVVEVTDVEEEEDIEIESSLNELPIALPFADEPVEFKCENPEKIVCKGKGKNKNKICKEITNREMVSGVKVLKVNCKGSTTPRKPYRLTRKGIKPKGGCNVQLEVCVEPVKCEPACGPNAFCGEGGQCQCNRGFIGDPYKACEEACQCRGFGDVHYVNYDGQRINFQGLCKYTLSKMDIPDNDCNFEVLGQNVLGSKDSVSVTKHVEFTVFGNTFKLLPKKKLEVNGVPAAVPGSYVGGRVKVQNAGKFMYVTTPCVHVSWNGKTTANIYVPKAIGNDLTGLCGDCNDDQADSFIGPDGVDYQARFEGEAERDRAYGDLFLVPDPANAECPNTPLTPECTSRLTKGFQRTFCKYLLSSTTRNNPMYECVKQLPEVASQYLDDCVIDLCSMQAAKTDEKWDTACDIYTEFVAECRENSFAVSEWPVSKCKPTCGENMEYKSLITSCEPTCASLDESKEDICALSDTADGCVCLEGFYRNSDDECVPEDQCGCTTDSGMYIPVGQTKKDCVNEYTCETGGLLDVKEIGKECGEFAYCSDEENPACVCGVGYEGDGFACASTAPFAPDFPPVEEGECQTKEQCPSETFVCENNQCVCMEGYSGVDCNIVDEVPTDDGEEDNYDPIPLPLPLPTNDCQMDEQCGDNAYCNAAEACQCFDTYVGDPQVECTYDPLEVEDPFEMEFQPILPPTDPCDNCPLNSNCINEECVCDEGYQMENGQCIDINECSLGPCQNGGTCQDEVNGYTCTCADGYTGDSCETNIDDCTPSPCKNGGSCQDQVNGYTCTCADGYTGDNCETEVDPCDPEPCHNGATCVSQGEVYTCTCAPGYTGPNCDEDIDDCTPGPCKNGGSCQDQVNGYTCTCADGYTGDNCETEVDPCDPEPCHNGATCVSQGEVYTCTCAPGYTGPNCDEDIDDCTPSPCKNGGSCQDQVNGYTCTCADGYTGDNCETEVDPCDPEPCHNGATCVSQGEVYTCTCAPGYTGPNCDEEINECDPDPCKNGGTCTDKVLGYSCTCAPGYTGGNCDEDINDCENNPCQNGGTCHDLINDFRCDCSQEYTGRTCNEKFCDDSQCQANAACKDGECQCKEGFKASSQDPQKCVVVCGDKECPDNSACAGTRIKRCKCNKGFYKIGFASFYCSETCGDKVCGTNERCNIRQCRGSNPPLSCAHCDCLNGYQRDESGTCRQSCGSDLCDENAKCVKGKCTCKRGYGGDGMTCHKLCGRQKLICSPDAECVKGACKCNEGFHGDGVTCNECLCSVTGDPNFRLFDGSIIQFAGQCKYLLSSFNGVGGLDDCKYDLYVTMSKDGKLADYASVVTAVHLSVYGTSVELRADHDVWINGLRVGLPYRSPSGNLKVFRYGTYVMVYTQCGLVVKWSGKANVLVSAPKTFSQGLSGMCGNCNGQQDDYHTKDGEDVSDHDDKFNKIGNSYAVPYLSAEGQCDDSIGLPATCTKKQERAARSRGKCGLLNPETARSPFSDCIKNLPELAHAMFMACISDYCNNADDTHKVPEAVCHNIEGFSSLCHTFGFPPRKWRRANFCAATCPANSKYRNTANGCEANCVDVFDGNCPLGKVETCVCNRGYIKSGNQCVLAKNKKDKSNCGVEENGEYFPIGFDRLTPTCQAKETVMALGGQSGSGFTITESPIECHPMASCVIKDGGYTCECDAGYHGDGYESCSLAGACQINEDVEDCDATVTMTGDCVYDSKNEDKCQFRVILTEVRGEQKAFVTFKGSKASNTMLLAGEAFEDCASFSLNADNVLTVKEVICECPGHV